MVNKAKRYGLQLQRSVIDDQKVNSDEFRGLEIDSVE
jgi:hypothetical protein